MALTSKPAKQPLFEKHLTENRYSAYLYSGLKVLYKIRLDDVLRETARKQVQWINYVSLRQSFTQSFKRNLSMNSLDTTPSRQDVMPCTALAIARDAVHAELEQ